MGALSKLGGGSPGSVDCTSAGIQLVFGVYSGSVKILEQEAGSVKAFQGWTRSWFALESWAGHI